MTPYERRQDLRLPVEICVRHYLADMPYLGLTRDLSPKGLYVSRLAAPVKGASPHRPALWLGRPMQLEFALPGTGELIWAQGEVCYNERLSNEHGVHGVGIHLVSMAARHGRALREYVQTVQKARLQNLLLRVQRNRQNLKSGLPGMH